LLDVNQHQAEFKGRDVPIQSRKRKNLTERIAKASNWILNNPNQIVSNLRSNWFTTESAVQNKIDVRGNSNIKNRFDSLSNCQLAEKQAGHKTALKS